MRRQAKIKGEEVDDKKLDYQHPAEGDKELLSKVEELCGVIKKKNIVEGKRDVIILPDGRISIPNPDIRYLEKKTMVEKVKELLDIKFRNEVWVNLSLIKLAENDATSVESMALIMNRSKDSITDLIKVKQLLDGLSTENITITVEEKEELRFLRGMYRGEG